MATPITSITMLPSAKMDTNMRRHPRQQTMTAPITSITTSPSTKPDTTIVSPSTTITVSPLIYYNHHHVTVHADMSRRCAEITP
jgi:hypothetical protein